MTKREEGYNVSDTGNWNVASDFSKFKIMEPLRLADGYSNIATFGHDDFYAEVGNVPIDVLKIMGFERLVECLITLIDNALFAIKYGNQDLVNFKKELLRIKKIIPVLYKVKTNQIKKTKELEIEMVSYKEVLERVKVIKSEINIPLNKNHLIYTDKVEFDPQKYKEQVFKTATERG